MPKKILFIFHEDSQSGAPNALLAFLKYVKTNHPKSFVIDVLVLHSNGGLENDLKEISCNFYKNQRKKTFIGKILKKLQPNIWSLQRKNNYDVIYGNTVITLSGLSKLKQKFKNLKILLHVHESEFMCNLFLNKEIATEQFKKIDKIITVSKGSKNNLINNYNVEKEKTLIIYPSIQKEVVEENNSLKQKYNQDKLILSTIGHPNLTKGTDFIPQIANILRNRNPNLKFKIIVVGVLSNNEYIKAIKLDIKKLNLDNYIELIPHTDKPLDYLNLTDIYLIPSREDSFSLMGLQAALFEKPIVNFKNAIGLSDILDEECSYQAEYLNLKEFVEQIEEIYKKPEVAKQKTSVAKQKCTELLDFEKLNQKHYEELNKFINTK